MSKPLKSSELRRACRPADVPFETTTDAAPVPGIIGQDRALEALRFGSGMRRRGYHFFVVGPPGVGKQTLLRRYLGERAARLPTPSDWCYVHNFAEPTRPRAIEIEAGAGTGLRRDVKRAVEDLRRSLRSAFQSEEYRARKQAIVDRLEKRQEEAIADIQETARRRGIAVVHTSEGIAITPMRGGSAMSPEDFQALPKAEREKRQAELDAVGAELQEALHRFQDWERDQQEELKSIGRDMAASAARYALGSLKARYASSPSVRRHVDAIERDIVECASGLLEPAAEGAESPPPRAHDHDERPDSIFDRYQVNLLVDRSGEEGAPVVREDHPSYANLVGRVEHEAQYGALLTHFRLIKAGALHRAAGGFLILDALKLLQSPFAWESIKRTLKAGEVQIEPPDQSLGFLPVASLKPEAIPLGEMKLVLTGDRMLYHQLAALDPEFPELFKVLVDFEDRIDRAAETEATYANLLATLIEKEGLRPFDRSAVARVLDHAVRLADDAEKLSVHMRSIVDLLGEVDYWAGEAAREVATAEDVRRAIEAQRARHGQLPKRMHEAFAREDILVATEGERVGQVNGLTVISLGDQRLGYPARITATTRVGRGEVVDIEREVELGGPIHSKGVLIVTGLLASRYAPGVPLSLAATLVFEQSYGPVEGDSASLAELCALLSSLAKVPARQSIAMTGSVNQRGDVQSVGGVNEKIEGFFDICSARGLSGEQGVIIPQTNVKNLMLREDLVEAAAQGRFHVYAVASLDEAVEILTQRPAGARDAAGHFPENSVNALVERQLLGYAAAAREFAAGIATAPRSAES